MASMNPATVDKLIWLSIFGGLLLLSLGLFVRQTDAALGLGFIVVGAVLAVAGAVLIWVRSKMDDPK